VVLAQVSVRVAIGWDSDADARNNKPVWLARRILCDDREDNFAVVEILKPFLARNNLAAWRKDG